MHFLFTETFVFKQVNNKRFVSFCDCNIFDAFIFIYPKFFFLSKDVY